MKDMYDDLPQKIVNMMLERFQINGVIPVSLTDIRALISEMMMSTSGPYGQILQKLNEISSNQTTSTLCTSSSTTISATESTLSESVGIVYYWRGYDDKVHTVPYGFKFPSYNVSTMWNLWIFGDSVRKICPYHQISSEHDLVEKVCKTNRSRTKKVINYMIKLACEKQLIQGIRDVRDLKQSQTVFEYAYPCLLKDIYDVDKMPTRPNEININTVANRLISLKL
jgi:hypothetical protein